MIKKYLARIGLYLTGQLISAVGIVLMLRADIGADPWNILHQGISLSLGMSFGAATILVGATSLAIAMLFGESFGIGTLLGILVVGPVIDVLMKLELVPAPESFIMSLVMLIVGLEILTIGTWVYMSQGLGAGPRDAFNVALARKTHFPVGMCRIFIESFTTISGWLLGGKLGVGTVICAFGLGFLFQINFSLLRFDATAVKQENIAQTAANLRRG